MFLIGRSRLNDSNWSFDFYKRPFTVSFHSVGGNPTLTDMSTSSDMQDALKVYTKQLLSSYRRFLDQDGRCCFLGEITKMAEVASSGLLSRVVV